MKLLRRTSGYVGVDIGSQSIKVAQLARRGGELVLLRAVVMRCDQPLSASSDAIAALDAVGLQSVLKASDRMRGRTAAATMSMAFCEYQAEPLRPDADETTLPGAAAELSSRNTQLTGDIEHDYWVSTTRNIARGTSNSTLHVLSTPAATAETIARDHRAGGYTCQVLDGLPVALARALRLGGSSTAQPVAAIDWGFSRATLCVAAGGEPAFVRTFRTGEYGRIVEQIRAALNLSPTESRRILTTAGVPQLLPAETEHQTAAHVPAASIEQAALQKKILDAATPALANFREELERSLGYLRSRHNELLPTEIVLLGGGATIANIAQHVAQWTGIRTRVWDFPCEPAHDDASPTVPACLLGPAIAMSALAWE